MIRTYMFLDVTNTYIDNISYNDVNLEMFYKSDYWIF